MKRFLLIILFLSAGIGINTISAQVNININLDSQPDWGPKGYKYVESYYLPEHDIYYNVPDRRYYYFSGNRWVNTTVLPVRYRDINFYKTRKVVLVDRYPFKKHHLHYKKYARYRGNVPPALVIRDYNHKSYKGKSSKNIHYKFAKEGHRGGHNEHFKHFNHGKHKGGPKGHR